MRTAVHPSRRMETTRTSASFAYPRVVINFQEVLAPLADNLRTLCVRSRITIDKEFWEIFTFPQGLSLDTRLVECTYLYPPPLDHPRRQLAANEEYWPQTKETGDI
jgi:hypothetical protein